MVVLVGICDVDVSVSLSADGFDELVLLGLALDSAHGYLYVASSGFVSVISDSTNSVASVFSQGISFPDSNPFAIIFDPNNGYVYATDSENATLVLSFPIS